MQQVTILIPNYKTLMLTKLCLRLIRKFTDLNQAKIIVIDNDSRDESVSYLRSLPWIALIERPAVPNEPGYIAHSNALDLALAQVTTPYVLSIHTDTLVKNADWLSFLIKQFEHDPYIAGVGSWKLEQKTWIEELFKNWEQALQKKLYRLIGKKKHTLEGEGDNFYYLRSHCAMYRTDLLKQYRLQFNMNNEPAGKMLHQALLDHGYQMKFLTSEQLLPYVDHINHATMILNPELGARKSAIEKGLKRISKRLAQIDCQAILADDALDK